ncbi:MAG: site-specific DNA-methyltransferase [Mariniphaga sp.]|nr:site-specific DNA-methyltransferase [Mariniphaga sp.]
MPTLQFKGKNIIWNHHLAVPFHTLDEVPELHYNPEKSDGNMIIEGDNLNPLKALLPQFAGKVKCIYIDPPYNTGNEGWIYNDNVNSPLLKDWIGKEVGKDDLTRHDKWLCMMVPRLKILFELLDENGVIFISIGEHELGNLIILMNDIFGEGRLLTVFSWKSRSKPTNAGDAKFRPQKVGEFVIAYVKNDPELLNFNLSSGLNRIYPYVENNRKYRYTTILTSNRGVYRRETMRFEVAGFRPSEEQRWKAGEIEINNLYDEGRIVFNDEGIPMWKLYEDDEDELLSPMYTFLNPELTGTAEQGKAEVSSLLGKNHGFDTIKPVNLIKYFIQISTNKNDYILDSFAGTGTTMQAVMELNKEDGSNRKCIMVQMPENSETEPDKNICKDITRERVKRAIDKNGYDSGFKYYRLGIPLDTETMLAGQLPTYKQFAKYVYYLCTGENLEAEDKIKEDDYYVGEFGKHAIFLVYKQDYDTLTRLALNLTLAENIKKQQPGKKRIVYAPSCFLDEEYLTDNQIEYVGIPYNLFQRNQ